MQKRTSTLSPHDAVVTPFDVSVLQHRGLIVSRFRGVVSDTDLLDAQDWFDRNVTWVSGYGQLIDISEGDFSGVSAKLMAELAARLGAYFDNAGITAAKVAIYAPGDMQFGMGRIFEAWANNESAVEVYTFRDRALARDWLQENTAEDCTAVEHEDEASDSGEADA